MLLVIGELTYYGTSIKTGGRVVNPVSNNSQLIDDMGLRNIQLPIYTYKETSSAKIKSEGFNNSHRQRLISMKCPITQVSAFRHFYNQMGEMYGIPQEIRAKAMGHLTTINNSVYKKR